MSVLFPGPVSYRPRRASSLLFGWRASDGLLPAYTGQAGSFASHASNVGTIIGRNGTAVNAGRGQPRFTQEFDAIPRLRLQGDTAGTYDERVSYGFNHLVQALSVYIRVRSLYALAAAGDASPGNHVLMLGASTAEGGYLSIARVGSGQWTARRDKTGGSGGTTILTATAETGAWVHPFDILVTLSAAGVLGLTVRDGSGVVRHTATSTANANLANPADTWSGALLYFGAPPAVGVGAECDYELVKVASGVKTLAQIEGLS